MLQSVRDSSLSTEEESNVRGSSLSAEGESNVRGSSLSTKGESNVRDNSLSAEGESNVRGSAVPAAVSQSVPAAMREQPVPDCSCQSLTSVCAHRAIVTSVLRCAKHGLCSKTRMVSGTRRRRNRFLAAWLLGWCG